VSHQTSGGESDADGSTHYIGHIPVDVYTKAELPSDSERLVIQS